MGGRSRRVVGSVIGFEKIGDSLRRESRRVTGGALGCPGVWDSVGGAG